MSGISKTTAPRATSALSPRPRPAKERKPAPVMSKDVFVKAMMAQASHTPPEQRRVHLGMGDSSFWNSPDTYRNMSNPGWWANPQTYMGHGR